MATTKTTETPTAKCLNPRCGRTLCSAKSIARGYGPTCYARIKAAAKAEIAARHKPAQIAKAEELIEQGGIVPLRRGVFQVVSSNGGDRYLTHRAACNCKAGLKGRYVCYHRIAAEILTAA